MEKKYIDTEEACRIIKRIRDHCGNDDMAFALNWAADCIANASTVDVQEVRHGRWVECKKADYNWCCSICGYGLSDNRTRFCYDCGAIMDGGTDNAT